MNMRRIYEVLQGDIKKKIDEHGFMIIGVGGTSRQPGFQYTIGLTDTFGFEIIVFGLPYEIGGEILNNIYHQGKPELDIPVDNVANLPVMFKECNDALAKLYAVQAFNHYNEPLKIVQMVLSDQHGKLPGDPEFDHAYMDICQPLLYR